MKSTELLLPVVVPTMPSKGQWVVSRSKMLGLFLAFALLLLIGLLPTFTGLKPSAHMMLALLAFAVVIWITEAMDYAISAIVVAALMVFLLSSTPDPTRTSTVAMGTSAALGLAMSGFSNAAVTLVGAACFIAAAMTVTGLDRRIALWVLSRVDATTNHILIGAMSVGFLLSFVVPSTTARVACLMPIMLGFIAAFKVDRRSKFAALLVITAAQTASIWNIGIKTAAAQNMVALGFVEKQFQVNVTWLDWFIAGAPFSAILSIGLYFVMTWLIRPEMKEIAGGKAAVQEELNKIGAMTINEKKLLILVLSMLIFWASEKQWHEIDTATATLCAVALMLLPKVGVMSWSKSQKAFPWGTILLFAVGISLGSVLLKTDAAAWLARGIVDELGIANASAFAIFMLLSGFLIIIHLGFASATALASTMIPIVIAVLTTVKTPGLNIVGMTMLLQFVVSFGFILPVNAPQNMIAYGTNTFEVKDFVKTGLMLTVIAYLLLAIFATTYWSWMGYFKVS
jgi:anion transporter